MSLCDASSFQIHEVQCLNHCRSTSNNTHQNYEHEQQRLSTMKTLLKRVLDNTHVFDTR
jgi:hypothetical protein